MKNNLDSRLGEQHTDQPETERKPFVAPHLEQHDKLPQLTGVSGDFCDIFPDACD